MLVLESYIGVLNVFSNSMPKTTNNRLRPGSFGRKRAPDCTLAGRDYQYFFPMKERIVNTQEYEQIRDRHIENDYLAI